MEQAAIDFDPLDAELPRFRRLLISISLLIFALFALMVYGYGQFGQELVSKINGSIGEQTASEALALQKAGQFDAAAAMYREALELEFDSAERRYRVLQRYANLLFDLGQIEQCLPLVRECVATDPNDMKNHYLLVKTLSQAGQFEASMANARVWYDVASSRGDAYNRCLAQYYIGSALENTGQPDEALATYIEGDTYKPGDICAYHAAVMLFKKKRVAEGLAYLDSYLPNANGWRETAAKELKTKYAQ